MDTSQSADGVRLFYTLYHPGSPVEADRTDIAEIMSRQEIRSLFIISSQTVDGDEYLEVLTFFQERGIRVRNLHVSPAVFDRPTNLHKIVAEISETFNQESCMVLSYGESCALLVIACYYVFAGETPTHAILRVNRFAPGFSSQAGETAHVYLYKQYLNSINHGRL